MEVPFPAGDQPDVARITDWVELRALGGRSVYKRGDLRSALAIEDLSNPDLTEDRVWDELKARSRIFGVHWPLRLDGAFLRRRRPSPVNLTYYKYLLCLSIGLVEKPDRELFELLVTNSLTGLTTRPSLHVGAPASSGMDPSFRERVKFYAAESELLPDEEYVKPPFSTDKDLGLDAVSWFPFRDGRSGYLHFLVQCATGADWQAKFSDLHLETWKRHINWAVAPVRIFSVPFAINMVTPNWVRMCTEAGLVLDRARLLELDGYHPLTPALEATVLARFKFLTQ
jgi:hypothetical protein